MNGAFSLPNEVTAINSLHQKGSGAERPSKHSAVAPEEDDLRPFSVVPEAESCGDSVKEEFPSPDDLTLHQAAVLGLVDEIKRLVVENPGSIEALAKDDADLPFEGTPLQAAAYNGQAEAVKKLLELRADAAARGNSNMKMSAMHLAANEGHTEVVEVLLEKRADHTAQDCHRRTPLELARGGPGKVLATRTSTKLEISTQDLIMLLMMEGSAATEVISQLMVPAAVLNKDGEQSSQWLGELRLAERVQVVCCRRFEKEDKTAVRKSITRTFEAESLVLDTDLNLSKLDLNLTYVPKIKVTLNALPFFNLATACDREVLKAVANTGNEAMLATNTVHAMVAAAWSKARIRTANEIILNAISLCLLLYVSWEFRVGHQQPLTALYLLAFIHGKIVLEELAQQAETLWLSVRAMATAFQRNRKADLPPLITVDNLVDLTYLIGGCLALYGQLQQPESLLKPYMALFSALAWFRLAYYLRGETWFGPRVIPIVFALRDTSGFLFFALICLAAGTHAYVNLELQPGPDPLYASFLQVLRLGLFGDFVLAEFAGDTVGYQENPDEEPISQNSFLSAQVLFLSIGCGVTILLMNLLIGVLSCNFDLYQDRGPELFNRARAQLLLEIEGRPTVRILAFLEQRAALSTRDGRRLRACLLTCLRWCILLCHRLFHLVLLLWAVPVLSILLLFCSWSGVYHIFVGLIKANFDQGANDNKYIWALFPENANAVELAELRSIHTLVKDKVSDLEDNMRRELYELKMLLAETFLKERLEHLEEDQADQVLANILQPPKARFSNPESLLPRKLRTLRTLGSRGKTKTMSLSG